MKLNQSLVTSDQHFYHDKIAKIRGFADSDDFTTNFVEKYNQVVQEHNKVYFLGDCLMGKTLDPDKIISKLNGKKYLILGNHDHFTHAEYLSVGFLSTSAMVYSGASGLVLTHYPVHPSFFDFNQTTWINVHGHLHTGVIPDKRYLNVCVDTQFVPLQLTGL